MQAVSGTPGRHDAVPADFLVRDFLHAQHGALALLVDMNQLCEPRNRSVDDFVAEDDGERLVADQVLGAEDGMAQPQRFGLADITEVRQVRNMPDLVKDLPLAAALEIFFEFERAVEVIFDRTFSSSGNDDDVFDAGCDGLLHDVLNQRLVDQREHLFGRGFGSGEKACAQSSSGNNGLTYIHAHHRAIVCDGVSEVKIRAPGNSFTLKNVVNIIREFVSSCGSVVVP